MHVENNFLNNEMKSIQDWGLIPFLFTARFYAEIKEVPMKAMKLLWYIDTKLYLNYFVFLISWYYTKHKYQRKRV